MQVYILPGGAGRNDDYFYDWLVGELRRRKVKAQVLSQNRLNPAVRARQLYNRYSLTPDTVVVGHSFGGLTALKWLELAKEPIAGVILVDVSIRDTFAQLVPQALLDEQKTARKKRELHVRMQEYLKSWNWKVNYSKVNKRAKAKVILSEQQTGKLFKTWKPGHQQMARVLGARLVVARGKKRHFTASEEPEVLKAVLHLDKSQ